MVQKIEESEFLEWKGMYPQGHKAMAIPLNWPRTLGPCTPHEWWIFHLNGSSAPYYLFDP
jgi:hypothetical protein